MANTIRLILVLTLGLMLSPLATAAAETTVVRYQLLPNLFEDQQDYYHQLLVLAMEETEADYGPFSVEGLQMDITRERLMSLVQSGELSLFSGMTSMERERTSDFIAVPFPLLRGLIGYRVLLIRDGEESRFDGIDSLDTLSHLLATQGTAWPDTLVLKYNALPVLTSQNQLSLFNMVRAGRADYMPRSVAEVWNELDSAELTEGLILYPHILLRYRRPFYFFVSGKHPELAKRIQTGLQRAYADGKFQEKFNAFPPNRKALQFLEKGGYHIIDLATPGELPSLKAVKPEYWIQ